ncbi:MAG: glyoxalase [Synechococcaceae cyanobacterium RM1_1_27]|nr:glyoxalase [Synechococcaceae cyanobacterium SM2_3_2]NJO85505.1 glyoxalase [Synechococcaceae cyanobacterium RM1_1_27]
MTEAMTGAVSFHLAFPVGDIASTKAFYADGLGCEVGRETSASVILNLFGHQLVAHLTRDPIAPQKGIYPRHFGLIFSRLEDWQTLEHRARTQGLPFYEDPKWRFVDTPLEHATFFLRDPFENLLEFKFYRHTSAIFGEHDWKQIGDAPATEDISNSSEANSPEATETADTEKARPVEAIR